jgi:hypothetical protein
LARRRALVVAVALAVAPVGCARRARAPSVAPDGPGVTIAIYLHPGGQLAVVDDRRWVELDGTTLVLDRIDPGAALASLVIEAPGGKDVGACTRERIPGGTDVVPRAALPVLTCAARGAPGRHLVRISYVSTALGYRAGHEIVMTEPARATLVSRFAVATPRWGVRGELALYDGAPGLEDPPRELARREVTLDGSTAVIALSAREIAAALRWIYAGAPDPDRALEDDAVDLDLGLAQRGSHDVWVSLELPGMHLAPGPVHVRVELPDEGLHEVTVPAAARGAPVRLPLWIDDTLRGLRQARIVLDDGDVLVERLRHGVANRGTQTREVLVEERLRAARRRRIEHAWPARPKVHGEVAQTRLVIGPGGLERAGFTIAYELE